MTRIVVLPLTELQASRLRDMADFHGESMDGMIKHLIMRGFHRYEADAIANIDEMKTQCEIAKRPSDDDEVPF